MKQCVLLAVMAYGAETSRGAWEKLEAQLEAWPLTKNFAVCLSASEIPSEIPCVFEDPNPHNGSHSRECLACVYSSKTNAGSSVRSQVAVGTKEGTRSQSPASLSI